MVTKRPNKDQRYRDRCFPGAENDVFVAKKGGYAPLPIIARLLLRHLKGAELKVWTYMLTRGGPASICYPTYEAIMADTGVETRGTVSKAINRLERIGLIKVFNDRGTRRYLLRDPRLAMERLFELHEIDDHELEDANDLLETLRRPLIHRVPRLVPVPIKRPA
jgi:hypothetical protein